MPLEVHFKSRDDAAMNDLDIGEVSRKTRVSASALRFYEKKKLIRSNGRKGLRRQYPAGVIERVALIALGQAAGFSLDEMARMFANDSGRPAIDRAALAAKAVELDARIRRMSAMRDGLRHAAVCPAPRHTECPKFLRIVRVAASGKLAAASPPTAGARMKANAKAKAGMKPSAKTSAKIRAKTSVNASAKATMKTTAPAKAGRRK